MNPEIFWQLTEAYRAGVYHQVNEDILTEEEYFDIQEWVESLIAEGYDLSDYTDDELYNAYLNEEKGEKEDKKRKKEHMEESVDLYDVISDYLVQEGYCNSYEDAHVIMANMSEEWRDNILESVSYSAKKAREGKDIGKPGKMFHKIAKEAGERYGSEERGKKVAGAILAKLRNK
jgi:uncharacterized protein YeeX (DUF496 family)